MSDRNSEPLQRADPVDVRVAEVWPAVDRLQRATGKAEAEVKEIGEFAKATAAAVSAVAHLAHDAGRAAQEGAARCTNCPVSEREHTRRQQKLRDAAAWTGVGVALLIGIAGLVMKILEKVGG